MKKAISVSILDSKNKYEILNELEKIRSFFNRLKFESELFDIHIHFDIMDGRFVENTADYLEYIKKAKSLGFYTDTHLMVSDPIFDKYVEKAVNFGTDAITIHYEINDFDTIIRKLNLYNETIVKNGGSEFSISVALKPSTDFNVLKQYEGLFNKILFMSVEPGLGGQKYLEETSTKLKNAKATFKDTIIQVDGGICFSNLDLVLACGVDDIVVGSYISKQNVYDSLLKLNMYKMIFDLPRDSNTEFDKKLLQIVKGGYGEDDVLLGIKVPNLRKLAHTWYTYIFDNYYILEEFLNSKYHEYRKFGLFCLTSIAKKYDINSARDVEKLFKIERFLKENINGVNNWDLTDEAAPHILGRYLCTLSDSKKEEKINEYLEDDNLWVRRIGVISLLTLARNNEEEFCIKVCTRLLHEEHHLMQKAVGWVLRDVYYKSPDKIFNLLFEENKNNKLPRFILSYATEKMTKEQKEIIRGNVNTKKEDGNT